jgi:hypothetical protein
MVRNRGAVIGGGWGAGDAAWAAEEMCLARRQHQQLVSFLQTTILCLGERQLKQSPSTMAK